MNQHKKLHLAALISGILLSAAGFVINKEIITEILLTAGTVLIVFGAFELIRMKLKPDSVKREEVEEKDERNVQISGKAATFAFYVSEGIILLLFLFLTFTQEHTLSTIVFWASFVPIISFVGARRYYNKKM